MADGIAIWKQIEQALLTDIRSGTYQPGDRLPTEAELSRRFGVNRHTVRRAISGLVEHGRVRVEQGRGMFVQENKLDYPVGTRVRFTQSVSAAHRLPGRTILRAEEVKAEKTVAENLGLDADHPVVVVESVGAVDNRPISYGISYFPAPRFAGMVHHIKETSSVTASLARMGVTDYTRAVTRISSTLCSAHVARHLELSPGRPILQTEGTDVDIRQSTISYNITQFAGDWVQLVVSPDGMGDG